jgi:hypothetical protein
MHDVSKLIIACDSLDDMTVNTGHILLANYVTNNHIKTSKVSMNRCWNILNWNIRGVNSHERSDDIRQRTEESYHNIVCLQETKREIFDHAYIKKIMFSKAQQLCFSLLLLESLEASSMRTHLSLLPGLPILTQLSCNTGLSWGILILLEIKMIGTELKVILIVCNCSTRSYKKMIWKRFH